MQAFAEAWADSEFVQQPAAQLPWSHLCTLLARLQVHALHKFLAGFEVRRVLRRHIDIFTCPRIAPDAWRAIVQGVTPR